MGQSASSLAACEYDLDAFDRLVAVDEAWSTFAAENDAPELVAPAPLGRSIFDFVSDTVTARFYRTTFDRVRASGLPVTVPFRCDSPSLRRYLTLYISRLADRGLRLRSTVERIESREPVPWPMSSAVPSESFLKMCSWCKALLLGGEWVDVEAVVSHFGLISLPGVTVTHGICPVCERRLAGALDRDLSSES